MAHKKTQHFSVGASSLLSWRGILNNPKLLTGWLQYQLWLVHGKRSKEMALLAVHLARVFHRIGRTRGPLYLAKYLKTSLVLLRRSIGGMLDIQTGQRSTCHYVPDTSFVSVSLNRSGLPLIILRRHRVMLSQCKEVEKWVRAYSTAFAFYKLIVVDMPIDVESVTRDAVPPRLSDPAIVHPLSCPVLWLSKLDPRVVKSPCYIRLGTGIMWSSGVIIKPGFGSLSSFPEDVRCLKKACISDDRSIWILCAASLVRNQRLLYPKQDPGSDGKGEKTKTVHKVEGPRPHVVPQLPTVPVKSWSLLEGTPDARFLRTSKKFSQFKTCMQNLKPTATAPMFMAKTPGTNPSSLWSRLDLIALCASPDVYNAKTLYLGRVCAKMEAAGKVRLFMVVNSLLQRLLEPISDWLFDILRLIPQDGTFNQRAPLNRLKSNMFFACFDLKSATDRFPKGVLSQLLEQLFGDSQLSALWSAACSTAYQVPSHYKQKGPGKVREICFRTGVPLGLKSTWALFTLAHHLLIQLASYSVSRRVEWFSSYAVVGDDVVICDHNVAKRYLRLVKRLGLQISLQKSLVSKTGAVEFVSRFLLKGVDLSPLSFKQVSEMKKSIVAFRPLRERLEEIRPFRVSEIFRWYGAGFRTLAKVDLPYWKLHHLSKRWFRIWLFLHYPAKATSYSQWVWWFTAGRTRIVPPEVIGRIHWVLREKWEADYSSFELSDADTQDYPDVEGITYAPWVSLYLKAIQPVYEALIKGEMISPFMEFKPFPKNWKRSDSDIKSKNRHSSRIFRLWESIKRYDNDPILLLPKQEV